MIRVLLICCITRNAIKENRWRAHQKKRCECSFKGNRILFYPSFSLSLAICPFVAHLCSLSKSLPRLLKCSISVAIFPFPESLPLVKQQFLQFRRSEAIKLNQTELFKHYAGNLVAALISFEFFLESLAITKMVTMTSESDKASSSVSKKTNAPTVVAPITEVAPNILVYKKVRHLLILALNVIDFSVALDRDRWSKSLSGCRARAAAWLSAQWRRSWAKCRLCSRVPTSSLGWWRIST